MLTREQEEVAREKKNSFASLLFERDARGGVEVPNSNECRRADR
jgi:hypothetical protein